METLKTLKRSAEGGATMTDRMARELEEWVQRTFTEDRAVWKDEVLRRAQDDELPREELAMLAELPLAKQTAHELVDEIERDDPRAGAGRLGRRHERGLERREPARRVRRSASPNATAATEGGGYQP